MKIITSESLIIQRIKAVPPKERWTTDPQYMAQYSSLDGSDTTAVRIFQVWASMYHAAQLSADGIYGPQTKAAYAKWGAEWEKTQPQTTKPVKPSSAPKKDTSSAPAADKPVVDQGTKDFVVTTTKTGFMDKVKALPMGAKIGIGLGAAAILGVIIWKLIPSKKG